MTTVISLVDKAKKSLDKQKQLADIALAETGCCIVPHKPTPRWYCSLNQKALNMMELTNISPIAFMQEHRSAIIDITRKVETLYLSQDEETKKCIIKEAKLQVCKLQSGQILTFKIKVIMDAGYSSMLDTNKTAQLRCDISVSLSKFKHNKPIQCYSEQELLSL